MNAPVIASQAKVMATGFVAGSAVKVLTSEHATGAHASAPADTTNALEITYRKIVLCRNLQRTCRWQWGCVLGGWLCLEVIINRDAQVSSGGLLQGRLLLQALPTPQ